MQEFFEKAKDYNNWHWQGSVWKYLLYAGILLVFLFSKRKMVRLILGWLPLTYLVCIYNPLFMTGMEMMGVDDKAYFARMFSFMPMMYAIAAGIVFLIGRIPKSWMKFVAVIVVCVGLILSGRSIYDQDWFVRAQNYAKVPNDTYEVAAILENTGGENVSVATFDPVTNYMRQVSNVVTAYARRPDQIWYMLNVDPPDVQAVMKIAGEWGMDFITSRCTDTTLQAFSAAGYEPFALTDNMAIYEVTGVRKLVRIFNEKRQIVSETIYDAEGNIEKSTQGYSTIAYEYDDRGYLSGINYLDAEGRSMMISAGYAGVRWERSLRGLIRSVIYVDSDEQPVLISGRYETRNEYDLKGRLIRENYYDADGACMSRTDAFYMSRMIKYDKEGLNIEEQFYGAQGKLTMNSIGYAEVRRTYDKGKRLISERYYDQQDALTVMDSGYAEVRWTYDENGNQLSEAYYDAKGNPVRIGTGYAEVRRAYNENGNVLKETYLDAQGELTQIVAGYAGWERKLDIKGNILTETYLDEDGKPINRDTGYAQVIYEYDSLNHRIAENYYDQNGKAVKSTEGFARIERDYTNLGDVSEERMYDEYGNLTLGNAGFAIVRRTWNAQRQLEKESYFDINNQLVNRTDGEYAELIREYDENGNMIQEITNPVVDAS